MSKSKYPWLHKMTPQQRSDMLDADFTKQMEEAERDEAAAAAERDEEGDMWDDYEALNRF
jgi:hypothetical protein